MVTITTNALDDITEYYDNVAVKYPNTWSIEDIKEITAVPFKLTHTE